MTVGPDPGGRTSSTELDQARHRAVRPRRRRLTVLVGLAVAAVAFTVGTASALVSDDAPTEAQPVGAHSTQTASTAGPVDEVAGGVAEVDPGVPGPVGAPAADVQDAAVPVGLAVPAIDLDLTSLDSLGVDGDGAIEVPADPADAGWLTASAPPGTTGPAVIAGHVDSATGPGVFARLDELTPGDEVGVRLDDGTSVTYVVTATDSYPKADFPTEQVYGPVPAPVLRLITCGGTFDRDARSYQDNVVVYAALAR